MADAAGWQLRVLWVGMPPPRLGGNADSGDAVTSGSGAFEAIACDAADVDDRLAIGGGIDVLVVEGDDWDGWVRHAAAVPVVLLRGGAAVGAATALGWLRAGAQDVLLPGTADSADTAFRLLAAAERHRRRLADRQSFATDVTTGLPHEGQLIEHMSHLLALREREPAPMALLVLRIEGFATTAARLGEDTAGALRRKVAVRLRAGVRASDVVASLGADSFAVLLSSIDAPGDAETVGSKLLAALSQPFTLAGTDVALATALGVAASINDGAQPAALLHRAVALAASAQAVGRLGHANRVEAGEAPPAANDDG